MFVKYIRLRLFVKSKEDETIEIANTIVSAVAQEA